MKPGADAPPPRQLVRARCLGAQQQVNPMKKSFQSLVPTPRLRAVPDIRNSSTSDCAGTRNFGSHGDRKSTRLNSSHLVISYAVFCLKKKKKNHLLRRVCR